MTELPNNQESEKSLREKVLGAIETGHAVMKPKWHFILRGALMIVGGAILILALVYVASLAVFSARQSGAWFAPSFGGHGWLVFLMSVPWILVIASLVFIAVLETLVRRYSFAYRRPLLYSVLGILGITIFCSIAVAKSEFHGRLMRFASEHDVPVAKQLYQQFNAPVSRGVHLGRINILLPSGFTMQNPRDESLRVHISPKTRIAPGTIFFVGDGVVVLGERDDDRIEALGIRKIDLDMGLMRRLK